ncbi:MAG: spore maturation protein [Methylotenera sp.]|nr:MAG: spore maturation protein [Methylotenera sp.]
MHPTIGDKKINKLLVLDGISGVPLGKEMHQAFRDIDINAVYADFKKFKQKRWYGLRSALRKALNKRENADSFYHFPKLDEANFEAYIQTVSPTVILIIGFAYKFLSPQFLDKIKRQYHISLFLYDTDSCNLYSKRREFVFFIEQELPIYNQIFSFSKVTTKFFKETRNLKASFFPFGAVKLDPNTNLHPSNDVLFVGSCDLRRIFLLEHIKDQVTIYGDRWKRNVPLISEQLMQNVTDSGVWGERLYTLLHDSKIVLNITRSQFYGAETGVNLRIFEALSAGCFLLTDYCEEVAELFVIGEEIEVFRNAQELKEKVDYYLNHPEERKRIAARGHERFLKEYTWDARIKELARALPF